MLFQFRYLSRIIHDFYRVDVSKRQEVLDAAALVKKQVGNITVLVNNAGIMPCRPLFLQSHDTIEKIFNVNVLAHFWVRTDS